MANSSQSKTSSRLGPSAPLVPPLYQSSVYTLPDLDALDRISDGQEAGYIYARDAHPNARWLAERLAVLEGASWAVVCGSGMAAITAGVLALTQQGDRLVASNRLYGRTTQLLGQELVRYGVQTTFVDVGDLEQVRAGLAGAKALLVETMSNPLVRVADIGALVELAHEHGCLLVVDNTFATPVLSRPLERRADLVVESLTKMIGGHSDVTLGLLGGRDNDLLPQLTALVSIWGLASNPFDCWLAARGLATLPLRMRAATANAAALADWLAGQVGVSQVVYPGRPDHPDHDLARRQFPDGCGNMLCFELRGGREAVNRFLRAATGIPFSPSLGHTATTCSHPASTSHRYLSPAERRRQGIGDGLIRLSVGVEDLTQIQQEMAKGLFA
jgi:cystathionine beta-lyase/cystathionine gamma-synthase